MEMYAFTQIDVINFVATNIFFSFSQLSHVCIKSIEFLYQW